MSDSWPGGWGRCCQRCRTNDYELARLDQVASRPNRRCRSTHALSGWADGIHTAVGPQVRSAHAGGRDPDDAVGWLDDRRVRPLLGVRNLALTTPHAKVRSALCSRCLYERIAGGTSSRRCLPKSVGHRLGTTDLGPRVTRCQYNNVRGSQRVR